ncbi:ribbon-helix-helix domain-containing protein [Celeribacter halophilus]|uniref:ribbon-helix-helix domain-containing protein n=1 Tax=Celeribacter halophilus TaxID=576117 RepID=UPI003A8E0E07
MTVKSSISLSDPQDMFARSLVESGKYASLSSVLQHGLDLLKQKTEAEDLEVAALRQLVDRRLSGPMVSSADMDARIEQMIALKLQSDNVGS